MSDDKKQPDALIGQKVGNYTILEEIGRGGMATVYSARQESMNRVVAIKVLPRQFMHDPSFFERFQREVEVISQLEHPHILPIYDYGETDGMPYIAMRYLGGGSMQDAIRKGQPDLKDIIKPLEQIGDALDYAHQQDIIHRDLKPGNIMLDENGNAYLSDFGIARVMGSEMTGSAIIGTPAYMSPEQANGMQLDHRSDIYALGVVLFELITGQQPFIADTPIAIIMKHVSEALPPAADFREDVPLAVDEVIETATAKDPAERYSTAGQMASAYRAAIEGALDTQAAIRAKTDVSPIAQTDSKLRPPANLSAARNALSTPEAPAQPEPETAGETPSRSPLPLILGVVVLLMVLGGGALFLPTLLNGNPTQAQPTPDPVTLLPTPFRSAQRVNTEAYTLSIVADWMPINSDYTDESDVTRLYHIWLSPDDDAYVALAIPDDADIQTDAYIQRYWNDLNLAFIDKVTAEDGTIRQSYRLEGEPDWPNGQLDLFFIPREGRLAVLELFTADRIAADSTTLDTLQLILDSLRLSLS